MSELSAITLESVSRFEKGVTSPLLKSITADLKKGQLIAVVGADGAGKTTLMRVMAGLLKPQGGLSNYLARSFIQKSCRACKRYAATCPSSLVFILI